MDGLAANGVDLAALGANMGSTDPRRFEADAARAALEAPRHRRGSMERLAMEAVGKIAGQVADLRCEAADVAIADVWHAWILGVLAGEIEPTVPTSESLRLAQLRRLMEAR